MNTYQTWYQASYPKLAGYGLWLRGPIRNSINLKEFDTASSTILIARLSTFADTSESITHQVLYGIARSIEGVFADCSFLPPPADVAVFADDHIPWLLGTHTKRGPRDFSCIAFSLSIVQEMLNIETVLTKSGIPVSRGERLDDESIPLILLGGASSSASALLCGKDSPVDGIYCGDSTDAIRSIFLTINTLKKSGTKKRDILLALSSINGFILSDKPESTSLTVEHPLHCNDYLTHPPLFAKPENNGKATLQISEGCPAFCSFCAESWNKKPYREVSVQSLLSSVRACKAGTGCWDIDLYSFNFSMHRDLYQILWNIPRCVSSIGLKSQRLEMIAHDPGLLPILHAVDKTSITLGLEGISARLRRYLAKSLSQEDIRDALIAVFSHKIRELKIFLIATGLENDEDIAELAQFVDTINALKETFRTQVRVIFSITPLVRFPFTPLALDNCSPVADVKKIVGRIGSIIRARHAECRSACTAEESFISQALIRPINTLVYTAFKNALNDTGFIYYKEIDASFYAMVIAKLALVGISPESILKAIDPQDSVPFLPVKNVISDSFLEASRKNVLTTIDEGFCLGTTNNHGTCRGCEACDSQELQTVITHKRSKAPFTGDALKALLKEKKVQETPLMIEIIVDPLAKGLPREVLGAAIIGSLAQCFPHHTDALGSYKGSYWSKSDPFTTITGHDIVTIKCASSAMQSIALALTHDHTIDALNANLVGMCSIQKQQAKMPSRVSLSIVSPFPLALDTYFSLHHLKYTAVGKGKGVKEFSLTPQSYKKNILSDILFTPDPTPSGTLTFCALEKFVLRDFCTHAVALPSAHDWVKIAISAHFEF